LSRGDGQAGLLKADAEALREFIGAMSAAEAGGAGSAAPRSVRHMPRRITGRPYPALGRLLPLVYP
jgi:hypothetical protein